MTKQQIRWASQHDWFLYEGIDGMSVVCRDYDSHLCGNGEWHHDPITVTFSNFRELRVWAGY
jgi:hypothetical protein